VLKQDKQYFTRDESNTEDKNGDSRNWGKRGNKKLHGCEFDRFTNLLEYKAEENGTPVDRKTERNV
jgi:putative transposase